LDVLIGDKSVAKGVVSDSEESDEVIEEGEEEEMEEEDTEEEGELGEVIIEDESIQQVESSRQS